MRSVIHTMVLAFCACASIATVHAQSAAPAGSRSDLYHVLFIKAAAGKAAQMEQNLKKIDPHASMPGHTLVLRHQEGDAWDFVEIEHLGSKATIEATRPQIPPEQRNLGDWHNDSYVTGPSWAEFTKALGIDEASRAKSAGAVYVVATYRSVTGQRDALDAFLSAPPDRPSDTSAGAVVLQHLEGAEWSFLAVTRYNSWQEFATNESNSVVDTAKNPAGGWFKLRELIGRHTDTLAVRVAP